MRLLILALTFTMSGWAVADDSADREEINTCLSNWKTHPFKSATPEFRIMSPTVKVMGVGGEVIDGQKTEKPELVLVRPAVNVMSKSVIKLMNPNGWYCLKNQVAVMGKTSIELDCKAKMTSSRSGATVLGADDEQTGVTVMGKTEIKKVNCGSSRQ